MKEELKEFLIKTDYIDIESKDITNYILDKTTKNDSQKQKAVKLFYAVRDDIKYNPYLISPDKKTFIASTILNQREGYCVQKAIVYAALCRATEIPCKLGFAIVKNHLTTKKLRELLKSDIFVFHGYNAVYIEDKWVKATPTFDIGLCNKFGIKAIDFDGKNDSIFHKYDRAGHKHMEYIYDYGTFADLPYDLMISEVVKHYPHLAEYLQNKDKINSIKGNFHEEAEMEKM